MTEPAPNRNRPAAAGLLLALLFPGIAAAQTPEQERNLLLRHREWLRVTETFILPLEKETFLSLPTERDRDMFMEAFWKQRDPVPDTPRNEFREEMEKRFRYVMDNFGRASTRPAWQSDRGRVYMTLGPPQSKDDFEGTSGLHPASVWHYKGDPLKKLPPSFDLIFFRRGGGGDYKLYDPVSDGPASLLVDTRQFDRGNAREVYQKIRDYSQALARAALSVIPGQTPYNYTPSPQNPIIIADILNSAKRGIGTTYITHFLNYRDIVGPEYLPNFVESDAAAHLVYDPARDAYFLHFSVLPRHTAIDYDSASDQYTCDFKLTASLKRDDKTVFSYVREYPYRMPFDQVEGARKNGIAVQDFLPVAEGRFRLTVLLQNAVGKEFSLFEKTVEVPSGAGPAALTEPVFGHGFQDEPGPDFVPYKFLGRRLLSDPRATISGADSLAYAVSVVRLPRDLWEGGTVEIAAEGSQSGGRPIPVRTVRLADLEYAPAVTIAGEVPAAAGLRPEYYRLTFTLKGADGKVLGAAATNFVLSPVASVPHAVPIHYAIPPDKAYLLDYGLAVQYDQLGAADRAEAAYRRTREANPGFEEGMFRFADFLVRAGKAAEALDVVGPFAASEGRRFDFHLIKGLALKEKGEHGAAVEALLEARKVSGDDTRLLNALGFCYAKTGKKAEAREALAASLRLVPGQGEIQALLDSLEKE